MRIAKFDEPELQFGTQCHIDIRFGIMNYCPLDFDSGTAPKQIKVGIVGNAESIEGVREWLKRCRNEIPAKASRQPNLFPRFPGFNADCAFRSELVLDSSLEREIPASRVDEVTRITVPDVLLVEAATSFVDGVRYLLEKRPADAIICAIPNSFLEALDPREPDVDLDEETDAAGGKESSSLDFHHLLKARCMAVPRACPIQIVLPATYDPSKRRRGRSSRQAIRPLQDEATRAWNLHTALYYKAGGTPWRLKDDPSKLQTCFVGVGFFRTLDRERIFTAMAQVFNERGKGVVVRGGPATIAKDDRQPHLDGEGAYQLMMLALRKYEDEHSTRPARVVVHKTSAHSPSELDGFRRAVDEYRVHSCELLSMDRSFIRLFRNGEYPPLRGTFLSLDAKSHILYTRGSVDFYATYPGMYMPRSLLIGCDRIEQTPNYLANEALSLTKMNWNDTQFDGGTPITIRAARQVGNILKYVNKGDPFQPHYSYYM